MKLLAHILELLFQSLLVENSERFCFFSLANKHVALPTHAQNCERLLLLSVVVCVRFVCEVLCTSFSTEGSMKSVHNLCPMLTVCQVWIITCKAVLIGTKTRRGSVFPSVTRPITRPADHRRQGHAHGSCRVHCRVSTSTNSNTFCTHQALARWDPHK